MHTRLKLNNVLGILLVLLLGLVPYNGLAAELCPKIEGVGSAFMLIYATVRDANNQLVVNDGARVEVYTPRGTLAGCRTISPAGVAENILIYGGGQNGAHTGDALTLKFFDKNGVEQPVAYNPVSIIWTGNNGGTYQGIQMKVASTPIGHFFVCIFEDTDFDNVQSPDEPCFTTDSASFLTLLTFHDSQGGSWTLRLSENDYIEAMVEVGEVNILVSSFSEQGVLKGHVTLILTESSGEQKIEIPLYPERKLYLPLISSN